MDNIEVLLVHYNISLTRPDISFLVNKVCKFLDRDLVHMGTSDLVFKKKNQKFIFLSFKNSGKKSTDSQ
jgi:hypothetical protein